MTYTMKKVKGIDLFKRGMHGFSFEELMEAWLINLPQ
jgi:hypothetical protein